ncbi:MAG: S-layer homology domain-containing protein [Candidatus Ancillula trichonymphae]|nr:S-layer homology domain-containing protein [Candidatus Ancillula trichonymphae]
MRDAQFKKDIETLLVRNIATGVKDANGKVHFFGDHNVTRGQVAAFLFRVAGKPNVSSDDLQNSFVDSKGHQFEYEIAWLRKEGFAAGIDGKLYPDSTVKREELAKLIVKVLNLGELVSIADQKNFSDVDDKTVVDKAVREAILVLKELKVVGGVDGKFYPATSITQEQTAKIIAGALERKQHHKCLCCYNFRKH